MRLTDNQIDNLLWFPEKRLEEQRTWKVEVIEGEGELDMERGDINDFPIYITDEKGQRWVGNGVCSNNIVGYIWSHNGYVDFILE